MIDEIFAHSGRLESFARQILFRFPKLKESIKNKRKKVTVPAADQLNTDAWEKYQHAVRALLSTGDILLIHSSVDGFKSIGVTAEELLTFVSELSEEGYTIVFPAFPITNLKLKDGCMKAYDPLRTPCWTGMLPNYFLRLPGVVRSVIPYNTLAALGPKAAEMMADNDLAETVYGEHSPWQYCVEHKAKVLFLGTTANESNTIQTHMIADVMGNDWPIDHWYDTISAPVRLQGEVIEKKLQIQSNFWTQFVADTAMTARLKRLGIIRETVVEGCPLGNAADASQMVDTLVALTYKNCMPYVIPRRYYKKGWKKRNG